MDFWKWNIDIVIFLPTAMLKQVICTLVLIHWNSKTVLSYCPTGCYCNNTLLKVTCSSPSLSILPITLNPHITSLTFSNSQVQAVDDSLQFYEALLLLDLSNNQIRNIQDGAFTFQVGWAILITFHQPNLLSFFSIQSIQLLQMLDICFYFFLLPGSVPYPPPRPQLHLHSISYHPKRT